MSALASMVSGCVGTVPVGAVSHEQLFSELGSDPIAALRAIGSIADPGEALRHAKVYGEGLSGWQRLRVLRSGLGHEDERVVIGAAVLLDCAALPVPELRDAVLPVLSRLGEPDCPLTTYQAQPMIGSADIALAVRAVRRLSERRADAFLGALHREVRPDAISPLCDLARTSDGAVCRQSFQNAEMCNRFSAVGDEQLIATWLDIVGAESEPDAPDRLPGSVRAALRAWQQFVEWPRPPERQLDRRLPPPPLALARALVQSRPGASDLPLLRELLDDRWPELRAAAAWALGSMQDEASLRLLAAPCPENVARVTWLGAAARRGDVRALDELLGGSANAVAYGLSIAQPARRAAYFAHLLAAPVEDAVRQIVELGGWPRHGLVEAFTDPPYDDRYFRELEAMLASTPDLDVRLLRACVAAIPGCETSRLADRLLAFPAGELFAHAGEPTQHRHLAHGGVWAFLEVSRPEGFRARLVEGLEAHQPDVRDVCAELLVRMGAVAPLPPLATWVEAHDPVYWLHLARDPRPELREWLSRRALASAADDENGRFQLAALAEQHGMPFDVAVEWHMAAEHVPAVREALARGDAVAAFVASRASISPWSAAALAQWREPAVDELLRGAREDPDTSAIEAFLFEQALALVAGGAWLDRVMEPVLDGRYATHGGFDPSVAARAGGLTMLPFWIEQMGSNCCQCSFVDKVMLELFGHKPRTHELSERLEPACGFYRRTLLPVADRLRWSRLACGYVVAAR